MSRKSKQTTLDVICLGRAAVDLYGQQVGGRLEDMQTFAKYLGGSSANLAAGLARLGRKSAMLARVGNEQMGRFVREQLAREGVDVSHVTTDPSRLTGLVILGIGNANDIPHIFFRERCADMGLCTEDIDDSFVASARMLAITGTHLSAEATRAAVAKAIAAAKKGGTRVVLDIDYRPVLWGLATAGEGASRFAASQDVTNLLQRFLPDCDLIVGTEEEIAIAGGHTDVLHALRAIRDVSEAAIVLKRGAMGCSIFESGPIDSLDAGIAAGGVNVEVFNTVGAGDAFLAGYLCGVLEDLSPGRSAALGNACGALVVSRHGCTPAMPSRIELDSWLARREPPRQPRNDAALNHLHRATTWRDDPRPLCVLAFDHRSQFEQIAARNGRPFDAIGEFKSLIADVLLDVVKGGGAVRYGAIIDHRYGAEALAKISAPHIWAASPIETPGSRPLEFEPPFATGQHILSWPAHQVVKCLFFYHPDDDAGLRHAQEQRIRALYADVVALDRRLILEIICPATGTGVTTDSIPRALRRLYNLGVRPDWWKLEPQTRAGWEAIAAVIADCDPNCKGVVLLGLGADEETLGNGLTVAASFDICRGFAVGRSIFSAAAEQWFAGEIDATGAKASIGERYRRMIDVWCTARRAASRRSAGKGA